MSNIDDVYQALVEGQRMSDALRNMARGVDAWDRVRSRERVMADGMKAFDKLRQELNRRPVYNEPAEDFKPTGCMCSWPNVMPPCSYCTDPANNPENSEERDE